MREPPWKKVALNFLVWTCVFPSVLVFSYAFLSVPLISSVCVPRIEAAIARAERESPAALKRRQAHEAEREAG